MDKVKSLVLKHQGQLKYALIGCAALAGFNCLTRPDFNFILYLYIYYIWYLFTDNKVLVIILILNILGKTKRGEN